MRRAIMHTFVILFLLLLGSPAVAHASTPADAVFRAHGANLTLRGQGVLKVGYVFTVYNARLYMEETAPTPAVLQDVAKRLEIHYLRDIRAADLVSVGNQTLIRQESPERLASLQERLDRINSWYVDVQAGDQYTLTYVPGVGCELALNGKKLGTIEGADFAQAYFGIWLHPRTKYPAFRTALLDDSTQDN